ncbi:hypothetical protein [Neobacillus dielmonensis]|uniref:hypothetical protein n=1 Tax=Neobacillus dielmonensis TaxID=1347369 RepID=UPI0005A8E322|nr:hypothetical protein [Neobacillus dielmonensis]
MLHNNKGYFLFDLLLSLSAILLIGVNLVPLLVDLRKLEIQLEIHNQARQIVFEELHAKLTDSTLTNYLTTRNGIVFQIIWITDVQTSGLKEVCVRVDKSNWYEGTKVCGTLE